MPGPPRAVATPSGPPGRVLAISFEPLAGRPNRRRARQGARRGTMRPAESKTAPGQETELGGLPLSGEPAPCTHSKQTASELPAGASRSVAARSRPIRETGTVRSRLSSPSPLGPESLLTWTTKGTKQSSSGSATVTPKRPTSPPCPTATSISRSIPTMGREDIVLAIAPGEEPEVPLELPGRILVTAVADDTSVYLAVARHLYKAGIVQEGR